VKTIREETRRRASGMASLRLSTGGVIPAFIGRPYTGSLTRSGVIARRGATSNEVPSAASRPLFACVGAGFAGRQALGVDA
jgi:hypothetical protein